jgi:hypothetical protein
MSYSILAVSVDFGGVALNPCSTVNIFTNVITQNRLQQRCSAWMVEIGHITYHISEVDITTLRVILPNILFRFILA